jgi:hypothetical protein
VPPSEKRREEEQHREPIPPPVCCPRCRQEVLFVTQSVPGGAVAQIPWCERCGPVSLEEPPAPDPNRCVECAAELVWDVTGEDMQAICERCGPVELPKPKVDPREERPFQHEVDFGGLSAAPQRARGLTERDVVAAIRTSRPLSGPKVDIMLPRPGATRPG